MTKLKIALASFALIAFAGIASGQYWPSLPIVGGSSYCSSYGNNNTCTNTVPAGPALTGNETIPADTNLANGSQPQSVKIGLPALGAGKLVINTPVTTDVINVDAQTSQLIVTPAGTIAALTVNLPAASSGMYNGQRVGLCGTQIVTALTMGAGTGNSFGTTVTSQAMLVPVVTGAASCMEWIYSKTSDTAGVWYRVQ
jgi:hypothetical protein